MMQIFHRMAGFVLLGAAIFLAGCETADRAQTGQMASLEVSGHSEVEILRAMKAVFLADGYEHKNDLVFEKKGSAWDTAAYGDWDMGATWTRLKASVDSAPDGNYIIGCDAYTVNGHNQGVMENEQKNSYVKRSECKKILDEIKARLDSSTTNVNRP